MHKLRLHDFEDALHTGRTVGRESPAWNSAKCDAARSERESFENIRAAADSAVEDHRHFAADGGDDLRQHFEGRRAIVERTAAVIGDVDSVAAVLQAEFGVL